MEKKICIQIIIILFSHHLLFAQCPDGLITDKANLIVNGNFNLGNTGFQTAYKYSKGKLYEESRYTIISNPRFAHEQFITCQNHSSKEGKMMVVNGSKNENTLVWGQTIAIKKNTTYFFSTWINTVNIKRNGTTNPAKLQFVINAQFLGTPFIVLDTNCYWQQFYTSWFSGENTKATISIVNKNLIAGGNDFALDDIVFYECVASDVITSLEMAKVGDVIPLHSILFNTGTYVIRDESVPELDRLVSFLQKKPEVKLEISGHTDKSGTESDNFILSTNRAKAICQYLESKGISKSRLVSKGYGSSKPKELNTTYENRQKNRRVEFLILSK